jgi:predicted nucleic acid-binding protein
MVLANAGPLIALGKLNRLELLAGLYHSIQITPAVYHEVVTQGLARGASDALTVHLFWQRYRWPVVEVPSAVLGTYAPHVIVVCK